MTSTTSPDTEQDAVTRRYDRVVRFYDLIDKPMDLLGVALVHRWNNPNQPPAASTPSTFADPRSTAKDILDERFARGGIDANEYRHRLEALTGANKL